MTARWGGRRVAPLIALTLATKGRTCHLCHLDGATSADHDPPRTVLLARGVANPDHPDYLWPAHLLCNQIRGARPISDQLRGECRAKMLAGLGKSAAPVTLSSRFASRRPSF